MHDTTEAAPVAPLAPVAASPSAPAAPSTPRFARIRRLFLAPFRFAWRRPWRALGVLGLLVLLVLAIGGGGLLLWENHHLRAARREVASGHNWAAIEHLRSCRLIRPGHPEKLLLGARLARRMGNLAEAEDLLDQYWKDRGDDDALVLERLLVRAARGEIEGVSPLLQGRISQGNADAPLAREALVAGLLLRFRLDDADKLIGRWLESEPDSTLALLALGMLHEVREQSSEALLDYRRLLELDPQNDEVRFRMTRIMLQLHQGEEALDQAQYLHRRLGGRPGVMVQFAQALELQGRSGEARAVLDQCLRKQPHYPAALIERGKRARQDGDAELAEDYLSKAIQLDPGDLTARYQYYLSLNQNKKKAAAAKEQETIRQMEADNERISALVSGRLRTSPDDPAIHHEIAMISLRGGRPREALRWMLNALQIDPDHLPTHRVLSVYYHETGNPILAARHRAIAQRLASPK